MNYGIRHSYPGNTLLNTQLNTISMKRYLITSITAGDDSFKRQVC